MRGESLRSKDNGVPPESWHLGEARGPMHPLISFCHRAVDEDGMSTARYCEYSIWLSLTTRSKASFGFLTRYWKSAPSDGSNRTTS